MMRKTAILAFLLCAVSAYAQFTTVTGTVVDPHGVPYANGTIAPLLFSSATPTLNGLPYTPPSGPVNLDKNGSFAFNVADNTQLQPAGTKWNFTVCSASGTVNPAVGTGSQCFTLAAPITISGSTQNISTNLNAVALALTIPIGSGSCTPTGTNAIQYNNAGVCAGIANVASGSELVSTGTGTVPTYQQKAIYDTRDWATCNTAPGTSTGTDVTVALNAMLAAIGSQQATVRVIGTTNPTNTCLVDTISWPANVTLDFSGGGGFTLVTTVTPPGGGAVDGTAVGSFNTGTNSCSVTLNVPTSGDAVALFSTFHFATGNGLGLPTDTKGNVYRLASASNADPNHYSTNTFGWIASNVASGSITITIPFTVNNNNTCGAVAISGLGPSVGADGIGGSCMNSCNTNSPMSIVNPATFTAGSLLVAFGGQTTNTETCTAGSGFTQILNIGSGSSLCAQVQNSAAGGSVTPTQAISSTPTSSVWMYNVMGLKPILATQFIQGSILDPNLHQIFYQAGATQGTIDLSGATILDKVYPEWWGAGTNATPTANTAAIQAAINAAWGVGRTNPSGLSKFNRPLYLTGQYQINNELQMYDVNSFRMDGAGRLNSGIIQTATNKRIIDGQCVAYGVFSNFTFTTNSTQDTAHPLVDIDKNGVTCPSDLAPQFIDFFTMGFSGNNVASIGALFAKSGGGAQSSNIYCYDCNIIGFTQAGWQIGTSGALAQNALALALYGGDVQANPQFGVANYGGGFIFFFGTTFEAGYDNQTGADVYSQDPTGPIWLFGVRSESRKLCWCAQGHIVNSVLIDQDLNIAPGTSAPVGFIYTGNSIDGDGAHYQVTIDGGNFSGFGTQGSPVLASGGSTSTLVDTNQTIAGSVTIGLFNVSTATPETVTQAVSGASGTLLNNPTSIATVTGSVGSPTCTFHETMTQTSTGVTAREQAPSPAASSTNSLFLDNLSGTADATHTWTGGTSGCVYTPTAAPTFAVSNPPMLITTATGTPDSSHDWVGGTSGAHYTPTAVPASVNWTVNGFAGQQVAIFNGTNAFCYATIASNTANTLTITPPWVTQYSLVLCSAPDSTSTFAIEPVWNHGTVVSGGMTLVYLNEDVLSGGNDFKVFSGLVEDSTIPGLIAAWGNPLADIILRNVTTTRPDWLDTSVAGLPQSLPPVQRDWDVRAVLPHANNPIVWSYPTVGASPGPQLSAALQEDWGTRVLCWTAGTASTLVPPSNTSAGQTCIGGRSDPGASNSVSRNVLEIPLGILGRPSQAFKVNSNGLEMDIQGGLPSGTGTPGAICYWIGNSTSSGSTVIDGSKRWCIDSNGNMVAQSTGGITSPAFSTSTNCAQSGTAANPSVVSCTAAPAGAVACNVAASAGTCVVNTTAVGANSQIIVQETTKENTRLGVTCNTSPTVIPAITVASQVNGTSFTINMPTITTNPACFDYWIVNQ